MTQVILSFSQINCPDSLLYFNWGTTIFQYDPNLPLGVNNPTSTGIPNAPASPNKAPGLTLMPNLTGGLPSPTFYTGLPNWNVGYWNGSAWIDTGHMASPVYSTNSSGGSVSLGGCNGVLYIMVLNMFAQVNEVYKYTGAGNAILILTLPKDIVWDIATDCSCNFYILSDTQLQKFDPSGVLLNSIPVTGLPPTQYNWPFAIVANTVYTGFSNSPTVFYAGVISNSLNFTPLITGTANLTFLSEDFATCPAVNTITTTATISSPTLGCKPATAIISVSSTLNPAQYNWSGPGLIPPINGSTVAVNAPGVYSCVVSQLNCDYKLASLVTTVITNSIGLNPIISPTNNLCAQLPVHLYSSLTGTNFSISWMGSGISGGVTSPTVTIGSVGIYTLNVTDNNNGCAGIASATVQVSPMTALGLSSNTLCVLSALNKNEIILSPFAGNNYSLYTSPGFTTSALTSQPIVIYQLLPYNKSGSVGSVTLVGSNSSCSASTTANFTLLPLTEYKVSPLTATICSNSRCNFEATAGNKYKVYPGDSIIFKNDTSFSVFVKSGNTFTVSGTDHFGCGLEPSVINVDTYPPLNGRLVMSSQSRCVPFYSEMSFKPDNAIIDYSVQWEINGNSFMSKKISYYFRKPGTQAIKAFLTEKLTDCTSFAEFVVDVYPKPNSDFEYTPLNPVELVDEVKFTSRDTLETIPSFFEWSSFWISSFKGYSHSHTFELSGDYPVALVVHNKYGCSDTVVKNINVSEGFNVYVPNAFTPNDDGKNDLFYPVVHGAKILSFKVVDRWGKQLFSVSGPGSWDGTFQGIICMDGEYTWALRVEQQGKGIKDSHGSVILYR